jgi:type IV secretory pathway VirB10-like protein
VTTPDEPANPDAKVAPETLELRARPQPVTRINRKVLIGGAAVLLFLISAVVLLALKPPSLRIAGPQELFNVDHKPSRMACPNCRPPTTACGPRGKRTPRHRPSSHRAYPG